MFSESWESSYHREVLCGEHLQIYQKVTLLHKSHQELRALDFCGKLCLWTPVLLTCTEHVVSDFNSGWCLAGTLIYNGYINLLQNYGQVGGVSGPCFFQVSPASYPPFVTCQHQPVEGSTNIIKCILTAFSCLALLLQIALKSHLFLSVFSSPLHDLFGRQADRMDVVTEADGSL